ncbi:unnamed protein product [Ixodes pacificus]
MRAFLGARRARQGSGPQAPIHFRLENSRSSKQVTWGPEECKLCGGRSVRQSRLSRDRTGMSTMWKVGGACTPLKFGLSMHCRRNVS